MKKIYTYIKHTHVLFLSTFFKVASIFQQHPYSPNNSTSAESSSQAISTSPTIPLCHTLHQYEEI